MEAWLGGMGSDGDWGDCVCAAVGGGGGLAGRSICGRGCVCAGVFSGGGVAVYERAQPAGGVAGCGVAVFEHCDDSELRGVLRAC